MADQRVAHAHEDIQPVHPSQTGAVCSTCHAADNVELLPLKQGDHFQQVEAWAGGGHGKRLDGWAGRRVVMGCADCHDPHKPTIEQRVPFRAPRIERTGEYEQ
jgi:formate-dependent nitrite reductase cytochrome c552 subunit